jgi:hypothetical protein
MRVVKRLFAIVTLLALGVLAWNLLGHQHNIANGPQILSEVSDIRAAVPANASSVHASSSDASWVSGCSEVPGSRSGWTTDDVSISFTDLHAKPTVTAQIATALRKLGWQRLDSSPGPHQGRIAHWTLDVKSNHLAQAWAYPFGPGTHHWALTSSWSPPGPKGQGCP